MRVQLSRQRLLMGLGYVTVGTLAFLYGRSDTVARAKAEPPGFAAASQTNPAGLAPAATSDYAKRVVAYIYGTEPITREELGEYLIARMGADRLNNLVNRRIIDHVCRQQGIEVTNAEVEADFAETIKGLNLSVKEFESKMLKPRHMTLFEFKEDAVKPRLLLTKMCRGRAQATEEDLKNAYEAYYGEKMECRIIMWPDSEYSRAMRAYPKIRDSEEEFDKAAASQSNPRLMVAQGRVEPPFGRHTTGNEEFEKAAFRLQPGELSPVVKTPEGYVIIKCVKRHPPNTEITLDQVRDKLTKEIVDRKISQQEIPKIFAELRRQADPQVFLRTATTEEDLKADAQRLLQPESGKSSPMAQGPLKGN
jgi:hypothetical protein